MTLPLPAVQTSSVGPATLSLPEAIERAARIVHADHDRFDWRRCAHDACAALREVDDAPCDCDE